MVDPVASETWQSSSGTLSGAGGTTSRRGAWGYILRTATGSISPVCCRGGGALRDRAARVRADGEPLPPADRDAAREREPCAAVAEREQRGVV